MNNVLQRYLNDHLAGACGALSLVQDLASRQEVEANRTFLLQLRESVEKNRDLLRQLLSAGGMEESKSLQTVGNLTAKLGRLKLLWEGFKPGELGMFEAYELLALGIQGQRLLWVVLAEVAPQIHGWTEINFAELELQAIRDRDSVEERRIEAGRESLAEKNSLDFCTGFDVRHADGKD